MTRLANHMLGCLIDNIILGTKYPYMKPADIFLTALGALAILGGVFADIFVPSARWSARLCLIVLGIAAISSVLWYRI
jgi:hypothetical protein